MKRADLSQKITPEQPWLLTASEAEELTHRYFEAETSDEEESRLRRFLCSPAGADSRYDELRAVMGFLSVGRRLSQQPAATVRNTARKRHLRRRMWSAAAAVAIIFTTGVTSWLAFTAVHPEYRANACVAYVDGKRTTDTEVVMQQMHASFKDVSRPEDEPSVESQLEYMFETLDQQ